MEFQHLQALGLANTVAFGGKAWSTQHKDNTGSAHISSDKKHQAGVFQIIHENTPFKVFNLTVICVSLAAINNNNNDNDDNADEDVGGWGERKGEGEDERETQTMDILHLVQSNPRCSCYKQTVHIYK